MRKQQIISRKFARIFANETKASNFVFKTVNGFRIEMKRFESNFNGVNLRQFAAKAFVCMGGAA
jgi:hypothetical protein